MVVLYCGCEVTNKGTFVVGNGCKNCTECNAISQLHPFGTGRFEV